MTLRFRLTSRGDLADVCVRFLLFTQVQIGTQRAHSFPGLDLDIHQIFDEKSFHGGNTFVLLKNFIGGWPQPYRIAMRQSHESISPVSFKSLEPAIELRRFYSLGRLKLQGGLFRYEAIFA